MTARTPFVVAHRGASFDANENSASAITLAREIGAAAVEIDVHRSRDGAIVVHHDPDLVRAAGDPRRIADLSLEQLRGVRQRFTRDGSAPPAEPIITLDEALALAAPLPLVVEIKEGDVEPAGFATSVAARLTLDPARDHRIISFADDVVAAAVRSFPPARVGLIRNTEYGEDGWRDLLDPRFGIAVLSRRIATDDRLDALAAAGKTLYVYALDDADSVRRFARAGVAGIISNRPAVALEALRKDG